MLCLITLFCVARWQESLHNYCFVDILAIDRQPYVKMFFQRYYEDIRRISSGGVQLNLNLGSIKSTNIPLPPLVEQEIIVKEMEHQLSIIDDVEKVTFQSLLRIDKLRSILKTAFEGRLVPKDPSDEPIQIVLERIKEQAKNKTVKRKDKNKIYGKQTKLFDI